MCCLLYIWSLIFSKWHIFLFQIYYIFITENLEAIEKQKKENKSLT